MYIHICSQVNAAKRHIQNTFILSNKLICKVFVKHILCLIGSAQISSVFLD